MEKMNHNENTSDININGGENRTLSNRASKLASPCEIDSRIIFSLVDMQYACAQRIFFEIYFISQGKLDTTILSYNREYPNVGFPISRATEFDHRLGEVVAESKTGSGDSLKSPEV